MLSNDNEHSAESNEINKMDTNSFVMPTKFDQHTDKDGFWIFDIFFFPL